MSFYSISKSKILGESKQLEANQWNKKNGLRNTVSEAAIPLSAFQAKRVLERNLLAAPGPGTGHVHSGHLAEDTS